MSCCGQAGRIVRGFAYMAGGINQELSEERLKVCRNCVHMRQGLSCGLCGCLLAAKTTLPSEQCPDNPPKWLAKVS